MKIIAKSVEMVSWTDTNGIINPIRFRIANKDDSISVIKIDKVITRGNEKLAGNTMLVYKCQSVISELDRQYELKYELSSCKWILWKI
ncbi:hypothetical protein [Clostridium estertheticum]|uniref:Uncharacterized protein n=1 Tax=Clostridium estertheticum TaxID=238834 RepID=A0A7Y3WUX8_9CLOT|nr:hypothetical protein [Clostridium estertheticum]NNU78584.1 hypothetical protein [Clostridium estertheticum]WBL49674.1 hypothetical protein LOR37_23235 [Clostridium estertheticum]